MTPRLARARVMIRPVTTPSLQRLCPPAYVFTTAVLDLAGNLQRLLALANCLLVLAQAPAGDAEANQRNAFASTVLGLAGNR